MVQRSASHIIFLQKLNEFLLFSQEHGFKNVVLQNILSAHEDLGKVRVRCSVAYLSII